LELNLIKLCEDECWERTWIIQEILLGRSLLLMSGGEITVWQNLSRFILPLGGPSVAPTSSQ
jgi:hypothetical protein